ncbi:polysaccharide deacetylase family protein [Sphingomonas sp.]|uniref:polysaccharide deacetylase family protein n=1 Tax=Sphingomonas sp. TaxID=28214 RepID=UPI003B3A4F15
MMRWFLAAAVVIAAPVQAREIALTFDDLPAHSALPPGVTRMDVARDILTVLKAARVPQVYGFINGFQLGKEPGTDHVLRTWGKTGYPLGNHGWSHLSLSKLDEAAFEQEVARNEPVLKALSGRRDWRWFRFPFLDEAADDPAKRAASRAYLARAGYRIAAVTASFGDWAFNEPYARCVAKGDTGAVAEMEQAYLDAAEASIRLSAGRRDAAGETPPDILLMHLGAFDARMMPRLLTLYRRHGFSFVSLDQAARHPANAGLVDPKGAPVAQPPLGDAVSNALLDRIGRLCR